MVTGRELMAMAISQCETNDKIDQMLSLANGGQSLATNMTAITTPTGTIECNVPMAMLFSCLYAANQKKPLPVDLTNSPFIIEIQTNIPAAFSTGTYPASMISAYVVARTHQYVNNQDSIRNMLLANPEKTYDYPCTFMQEFYSQIQTVSNNAASPVSFAFSNFRKSRCIGFWLQFLDNADAQYPAINLFRLTPIQNIRIDRDGDLLYFAQGNGNQLKNLYELITQYKYSAYGQTNAPPLINHCLDAYYMSGSIAKEVVLDDGLNLQGTTINIQFNVNGTAPVTGRLVLHALYQGFMTFSNGTGEFVW